jgi:hypothetical protein
MRSKIVLLVVALVAIVISSANAVNGPHGEILTASQLTGFKTGQTVTVTGKHFDKTVGIYVR